MRALPFFGAFLCLTATAATVTAQQPSTDTAKQGVRTEQLALRFVPPSRIIQILGVQHELVKGASGSAVPLPHGIRSLSADDEGGFLVTRGSDDAIREMKEIVNLLDIAPRSLRFRVRLDVAAAWTGRKGPSAPIGEATFSMLNNTPVVQAFGTDDGMLLLQVQPRINGDGTISLAVADGSVAPPQTGNRRVPPALIHRRIRLDEEIVAGLVVKRSWPGDTMRVRVLEAADAPTLARYRLTITPMSTGAPAGAAHAAGAPRVADARRAADAKRP